MMFVTTDDAESKVTKEKLQEVLREFELDDDVNKVYACTRLCVHPTCVCFWLEDSSPNPRHVRFMCIRAIQVLGTPDRRNVDDLTLAGLTEVLMHKE